MKKVQLTKVQPETFGFVVGPKAQGKCAGKFAHSDVKLLSNCICRTTQALAFLRYSIGGPDQE